ncbi:hypothetical protein [Breoghania sp.]|uniref:hypothetical protein n=1 Tax=Breoghania sp. TaxID=2065378 RepID=UPI00261AE4A1|nr:hypothetical protein [Breoghania sp.]MDJ0933379.1 hypothetical protein [Breoghania sp.]
MSEFTRTRHLFLPCVQFELSVYPTGDSASTPIERAAMLLIGSFWEVHEKLAIDVFIDIMLLGEPGGRELINGLWRKGRIVIGGADATLFPSAAIQAHLREKGAIADFANMGTGERSEKFLLFYDMTLGQTFLAPGSKISYFGDRPYMIEPFCPESNDSPYGL